MTDTKLYAKLAMLAAEVLSLRAQLDEALILLDQASNLLEGDKVTIQRLILALESTTKMVAPKVYQ